MESLYIEYLFKRNINNINYEDFSNKSKRVNLYNIENFIDKNWTIDKWIKESIQIELGLKKEEGLLSPKNIENILLSTKLRSKIY